MNPFVENVFKISASKPSKAIQISVKYMNIKIFNIYVSRTVFLEEINDLS